MMPRALRRPILPVLLLGAALAACATPGSSPPPVPPARPERPIDFMLDVPPAWERAIERGTRTVRGTPGPAYWQQWSEYRLEARLLPDRRRIEGRGTIRYHNRSPDTLAVLHLHLLQNLHAPGAVRSEPAEVTGGIELGSLLVDGARLSPLEDGPRDAGYRVRGTLLTIVPPRPVPPGGSVEIEADWAFGVPQAGAGARMGHSGEDFLFIAYWYPVFAVYDDVVGWQTDAFLSTAEFYAGFGRYDVTITAPSDWLVVSTGELQNPATTLSEEVAARLAAAAASDSTVPIVRAADFGRGATAAGAGETIAWRFVADSVHDVAFSATRASNWDANRTPVGDRDGDGATDYALIQSIWRETAPRWEHVARYATHAIAFLSGFTGQPYPWPHMTVVEGGGIIGGGMEFPMMTLIGDYNVRGDSALYYVTAHELGHMWIPMLASSDERRYGWMDEGTTTFHENMARMDFFPGVDHTAEDREAYLALARAGGEGEIMRWSDYHYPGPAYGIASYQKPASVLVALREVVGEETFSRALHAFFDRWKYRHPYPWDLFHTFEDVAGRDLNWFWRAWYYETWTLDQAIGGVSTEDDRTVVFIEDHGRVPMPVPLRVTCDDGRTIDRTLPVDPWLAGSRQAKMEFECRAVRVVIDPDDRLPDVDRSNDEWPATAGTR